MKKNGHKFFREFTKIICFSNYSASKFWDPQSHFLVKVAKTGFGFHNNFFQVILFSERDSMIDFLLISHQKRFGNFPRKGIVRVQTGKLVNNSFFDVNWIFSRVLTKICIANQSVEDFSDYKQWLLCDKTETLSKACVTLSQFGALNEETIELKSDKKRIQNNSIFLFLFLLRRGNIKKFGSEPKLNVRQSKALSIRPCKIEAFGSILWGVEKPINWHMLSN